MKNSLLLIILFASSINSQDLNYTLTVQVEDLRNSTGVVQFSLYNKDGSIPDEHFTHYLLQQKSTIENKTASVIFNNLPKGNYAVNILHDENKDGKIDKGFVLPKEGIGFSNFESIGFRHKPNFKKAQFLLETNKFVKVKVIYF